MNEAGATIHVSTGGDFNVESSFHNDGLIVLGGDHPRELHRSGTDVVLGLAKMALNEPQWALAYNGDSGFSFPFPVDPGVAGNYGLCVQGSIEAGQPFQASGSLCDMAHYPGFLEPPDNFAGTASVGFGAGTGGGAEIGVGAVYSNEDSVNDLEGWSVCIGFDGEIPADIPLVGGAIFCKDIENGEIFPLGDSPNFMDDFMLNTSLGHYSVEGDLGLGEEISTEEPWQVNGYVGFSYTAVIGNAH